MSTPDSNAIFHRGDSQEILNYLNLRLKAGDLSDEEALAMLSAVHAELGNGSSTDPRVYRLYHYTLKSLQQAMPDIYDFIVATWNRRNGNNLNSPDDKDLNVDGDVLMENRSQNNVVEQKEGIYGINTLREQLDKTDDEEGPDELEEKETAEVEEKNVESEQEQKEEETDEVSEEESVKIEEEQPENNQEADEINDGSLEETDIDEPGKDKEEESESENLTENNDNETGEESIGEEVVNQTPDRTEKLETEGEAGEAKGEEMEWPEIEQPLPAEPIEGPEGRETSSEPED